MAQLIKTQTLRGFRDYLPSAMLAREKLIDTARRIYRSYGFSPIDTPAIEYAEVLLGKGGAESDKQIFRFLDGGERDVALRFDLTIPLARFAAQHLNEIGTPFKRYHIGTVWRGENTQRGRYREFMQCDFDTIGTDSNVADFETLLVIHDLMEAIGFTNFQIHLNQRMILNGVLQSCGLTEQSGGILRSLDKYHKVGRDGVIAEMLEKVGTTQEQAEQVLAVTLLQGTNDSILTALEGALAGNEAGLTGVNKLRELLTGAKQVGIPEGRVLLDVSIARGLDYYTGTVFETFLGADPEIGSVCSGGRYDNLTSLFTKEKLPGIGASLGLDRLLAAMEKLGMVPEQKTPALVFIAVFEPTRLGDYQRVARTLRRAGIASEVFPDTKPLPKQLKYADRQGIPLALIAGSNEFRDGTWQLKNLRAGTQKIVPEGELIPAIEQELSSADLVERR